MASTSKTVPRSRSRSKRRGAARAVGKRDTAAADILIENDTCWRRPHAKRVAALIDAAAYFEALRASLLAAEHTIFILGWELHSKMRLEGHRRPRDGAPAELGKLLRYLLKRKPGLQIRILLWNHPMFYAVHRELFPRWLFWRLQPDRAKVLLDSHLPVGASHHEKLVIVDDTVAYCGGVDLTVRRWDIESHHPAEPRRHYPRRKPYIPQHDVQLVVEGETAAVLGQRVRARWEHAGGEPVKVRKARRSVWPKHVKPDFEDLPVGVIRTVAALEERDKDIREIERCTVAALARAQRFVYIENQYITSKAACEALLARMRENPSLEAVIVTSCDPGGFLEAETMGVGRQHFMAAFAEPALARRIQFVAPLSRAEGDLGADAAIAPDGVLKIHVHAKVLIVDNAFLRIGSSNLNNRSMGFDTECDLGIEASNDDQRRAIESVRNRLIAEHWGSDEESVGVAVSSDSVLTALESLPRVPVFSTAREARHPRLTPWRRAARAPAYRSVTPVQRDEAAGSELVVLLGDPERVVSTEELIAQATGWKPPRRLLKRGLIAIGVAALLGLVVFTASRFDLGASAGDIVQRIVATIEGLAGSPWRVPLVLAAFVLASVFAVPILALIGATVVALGPVLGFACSAAGTMLAASATFGVGRLIGREPLHRRFGKKLDALEKRISKSGIIAIALIRKVPIAPFTFVNMGLGALGIRFRDFALGTALGMLPGIAAFSFVSERAIEAWREPTMGNIALIAAAIAAWLGVVLGIQHWLNRRTGK